MPTLQNAIDRRQRRSDDIQTALSHQLSTSQERALFNSIVLADENGLVMAWSGNDGLCEQMAAISPLLARDMTPWHGDVETNIGKVRLSVAPLLVDGNQLFIAAAAGKKSDIAKELFRSGRGVSRILQLLGNDLASLGITTGDGHVGARFQ